MATFAPGTRVGPYEVTGAIGAGGMGEVFRARDLTLEREVALKVIPPGFAADEGRRARFAREARSLAALNHPHVAQVYGVEDSPAGPVIAMEFVEGRSLRELLKTGSVARASVPALARQIALALDAAHEKGFIHRDLKPANIMVTPDGTVKLLDFGLAKAWTDASSGAASQDATVAATALGEIVGTPAYMSPEQATGERVDRRTDIWAFGCVLFEMLTGRPAFPGDTVSDTLSAVIGRDPDWTALPGETPPAVRALVMRCLEKDRRRRLRDIGDALHDLSGTGFDPPTSGSRAVYSADSSSRRARPAFDGRTLVLLLGALAAGAAAMWFITWMSQPAVSPAHAGAVRFTVPPPPGTAFGGALSFLEATTLEFSPDGTRLAFIATARGERPQIWLRPVADEAPVRVTGTEGAVSMFWSPDGRALGFFADGQLKRVDVEGGAPVKISDVPANVGLSGSWGAGGDILFTSVQGQAIYRVSAGGGTPAPIITAASSPGNRFVWPRFLPDGRRFLYTSMETGFKGHVILGDLGGAKTPLFEALSHAQWVDPGWVLFIREGTLLAQRVDLDTRTAVGEPVSVAGPVAYSAATGWGDFTASRTGAVAFQSRRDVNHLLWFDNGGRELGRVGTPGAYFTIALSPDDRRLLFARLRPELGTYDIWSMDFSRTPATESQMTTSPGMETGEVWLPGGREMLFSAAQGTAPTIHHKDLVTGTERRLLSSPEFQIATSVSPDGSQVFFQQRTPQGTWDILSFAMKDPGRITPVYASEFNELALRMSPTGQHVIFVSNKSGRSQIHLAPWPSDGSEIVLSTAGASRARWRRDGRAVYFLSAGQMLVAEIDAAGRPQPARPLFDARSWFDFDVARDGRFIANVTQVIARELPLSVILNWAPPDRR
jgi:Tol biopolymer transport system component/predicted Ser/Thr protein kinase